MKSRILLAMLLTGGMFSEAYAQGPPGGAMPPPQVTLVTVESRTVPVTYEYVGMTQASRTVEVRARVQGFLESRDFQEGAHLDEGAKLFTIDPRSFEADREVAAAQVEQAEARLKPGGAGSEALAVGNPARRHHPKRSGPEDRGTAGCGRRAAPGKSAIGQGGP